MKKIVFFLLLSFSISLFAQENSPDAINDGKVTKLEHSNAKSSTVIWEENFQNGFPAEQLKSIYRIGKGGSLIRYPFERFLPTFFKTVRIDCQLQRDGPAAS